MVKHSPPEKLLKEIYMWEKTKSCIPHTLKHIASDFSDFNIKALINVNILILKI